MDASSALLPPAAGTTLPTAAPPPTAATADVAAARKAAESFESYFLQQSFESMFSDVGNDKLFGGGDGETIYRSLLLQEYSKVAAKSGGLGIADAVQREMLQMQHQAH